jgi:hypothetical protein
MRQCLHGMYWRWMVVVATCVDRMLVEAPHDDNFCTLPRSRHYGCGRKLCAANSVRGWAVHGSRGLICESIDVAARF